MLVADVDDAENLCAVLAAMVDELPEPKRKKSSTAEEEENLA